MLVALGAALDDGPSDFAAVQPESVRQGCIGYDNWNADPAMPTQRHLSRYSRASEW